MKIIGTWKWVLIAVAVLFMVAFLSGWPQQKYKEYTLEKFYEQLVLAEQNQDWRFLYDTSTYEQRRLESFEEFAAARSAEPHAFSLDLDIHSIRIEGDRGIVDRTMTACMTETCEGDDYFEERAFKEYLFINGAWYSPSHNSVDAEGKPFETELPGENE